MKAFDEFSLETHSGTIHVSEVNCVRVEDAPSPVVSLRMGAFSFYSMSSQMFTVSPPVTEHEVMNRLGDIISSVGCYSGPISLVSVRGSL